MKKEKVIGITLGDPLGIGPQVVAKALKTNSVKKLGKFLVIGDDILFKRYRLTESKNCSLLSITKIHPFDYPFQNRQAESAAASLAYLDTAINLIKEKQIHALVTAPVSKEAISGLGVAFNGHTEYLADAFNVKNYEMMFVAPKIKVIIATRHIPLRAIPETLDKTSIEKTILSGHQTLKKMFKFRSPRIAVCGLNPHAGEGGLMGDEEKKFITPAIESAKSKGIKVSGPYPADTLFQPKRLQQFDLVIAMYHDQGLAPIKSMYFDKLVNVTIGLPFLRTSPAHGTAFDISTKNLADPSSMICAIKLCAQYAFL